MKNLYIAVNPVFRINIKGNEIVVDGTLDIGLAALPKDLDFGATDINSIAEKTIILQNTGNVALTVTRAEMENSFFSVNPIVKFPFLLRPGQKKIITIRFSSFARGLQQGLLTFYSNDLEHPPISLKAMVGEDFIRLSPPSIDFGKIKPGKTASFPVRIWNETFNPIKIVQATFSNSSFSSTVALPIVVAQGKSGKIEVLFFAADESAQEGVLRLTLDDPAISDLVIPLFGTSRSVFPDNGTEKMQSWEAINKIRDFTDKLTKDTLAIKNTGCIEFLQQFFTIISKDNPFASVNLNAESLTSLLENRIQTLMQSLMPLPQINAPYKPFSFNPFNLSVYQGKYIWQPPSSQFKYTSGEKVIRILFPEMGSSDNNSEFRISEFEEQTFTESVPPFRNFYQPTRVLLSLYKNQNQIVLLDLSFQYNANGPACKVSGEVLIHPFSLSFSYDNTLTNTSCINALLHLLSKPLASLALSINFSDKNKVLDELTSIEGNLKIRDVEINGIFDYALSQKSPLDKNKVYRLIFLGSLNKKIGEETILNEWSDERESIVETPYLIYNDSRKENLEILLKPWTDVLNTFGK